MPSTIVQECCQIMENKGLTVAFAESATAGKAAYEFSLTPNAGKILKGGLVCYDACIKEDILGISKALIAQYTPESKEVTAAMAGALRSFIKADVHIAITGLTTPGGSENEEKPVGTMFIHLLSQDKERALCVHLRGTAEQIVSQTIDRMAEGLIEMLL